MSGSDAEWGELVSHDQALAETWDGFRQLPGPDENVALDAFVERKHLTHGALVRIGARLADDTTLAFAGPGYLKFRDLITGRRWNYAGCEFKQMKIVRAKDPR
jgi:hypothetical protein